MKAAKKKAERKPPKPGAAKPGSHPRKATQAPASRPAPPKPPKLTFTDPDTGEVRPLPPLAEVVQDLYLNGVKRGDVVGYCVPLYGCSAATVDRAIALAKAETWEIARMGKAERIADAAAKLDHVFNLALEAGDRSNARQAIKDRQHILLDDRPEERGGLIDTGSLADLERQAAEQDALYARAKAAAAAQAKATPPNKSEKAPKPPKGTPKPGGQA